MSNPIKYSTGSESLSLKKGNFYIGTGDVGKGPSDVTGYYQGVDVPSGGYVIYMNKEGAPGGLSYHSASNDSELIAFTNNLAGQSYTTVNECLVYFAGQTDKVCLNRDYEGIVTDGLVCNLDAGFTPSYPRSGITWYDICLSGNYGVLTNGPTFDGYIILDGTNDYVQISQSGNLATENWSFEFIAKQLSTSYRHTYWGLSNGGDVAFRVQNFQRWDNGGYVSFNGNNSSYSSVSFGGTSSFEWNYFAIVNTPTSAKYYQNGVLKTTANNPLRGSFDRIWLGMRGIGNQHINAEFSNFRAYNRELSASEILQNYNAQKGRFGL